MKDDVHICGPISFIGQSLLSGILLEVSANPSPGLVSPASNGSHEDMNFYSFMLSSAAIAPFFHFCAETGYESAPSKDLLSLIRPEGVKTEQRMFQATQGVNTQKGIIFLGGITAAAAGRVYKEQQSVAANEICREVASICQGIVERELENPHHCANTPLLTTGMLWFQRIGITGIRGEVEKGLPAITETAYPVFSSSLNQCGLSTALIETLLHLMTVVEDTTVLARAGLEGLDFVKKSARMVLQQRVSHTHFRQNTLKELEALFIEKNISPGGSADLLAITVALWMMEHGPIPRDLILENAAEVKPSLKK